MFKTLRLAAIAAAVTAAPFAVQQASAVGNGHMLPLQRAQQYNWHGNYAHSAYGQPMAMVVPPTANLQTNWGWGVGSSRISRIDHQFGRDYPGTGGVGAGQFNRLPRWPHDTTNFGVYYVRGPW